MSKFATKEEICNSEKILFDRTGIFDDERSKIIKEDKSCDVEACPGSGKTTTLLAKLVILSNRVPLPSGRGICVLTHTNVAIDEIKRRLGAKAVALFSYPNFFGTIQAFVDKYLSNAALHHYYGVGISSVDDDKAFAALSKQWNICGIDYKKLGYSLYYKFADRYKQVPIEELSPIDLQNLIDKKIVIKKKKHYDFVIQNFKTQVINNLTIGLKDIVIKYKSEILKKVDIDKVLFKKKSYIDYVSEKEPMLHGNNDIKMSLSCDSGMLYKQIKESVYSQGILSYKDSYHLALRYLKDFPQLKNAISNRFEYLFIDEMQDTDDLQNFFFEKAFDKEKTIIQCFGDSNQAIYDDPHKEVKKVWSPINPLKISQSLRFGVNIAKVLRTICLSENHDLKGNIHIQSLKPIIIVYDDPIKVIPKFFRILQEKTIGDKTILDYAKEEMKQKGQPVIKAIGWIKSSKNSENLGIKSYFPSFDNDDKTYSKSFNNLYDYLTLNDNESLKDVSDNITDGILRLLHISCIRTEAGKDYSKTNLLQKFEDWNIIDGYRKNLAKWSSDYLSGRNSIGKIFISIKSWINGCLNPHFLMKTWSIDSFFDSNTMSNGLIHAANTNMYNDLIEVSTIHGVKGETHIATLYMETTFHNKTEGQMLKDQIRGIPFASHEGDTYIKQALKVAYVGMSRPRLLLCFAIRKDHLPNSILKDSKFKELWSVEKTFE